MLELLFLEGAHKGETIRVDFESAWFGRQPTCDFVLRDEGISRVHFSISKRGADYVVVDNNSTNGIQVNNVRVPAATLSPGIVITAGASVMQVRTAAEMAYRFVVEKAPEFQGDQREANAFEQASILLGRKTICQVLLNDERLSPVHAEIESTPDGVFITDQNSDTGVYVNGARIVRHKLADKDRIGIRPYLIAVELKPGMCYLRVLRVEAPAKVEEPGPAAGSSRRSDAISALPEWQREKAPIYVPTSDLHPARFRNFAAAGIVALAMAVTAGGWFARQSLFQPGPVVEAHSAIGGECASCHTGFASAAVQTEKCQSCHEGFQAAGIHAGRKMSCGACHTEHLGEKFDFALTAGATCQSAGCHATVHAKQEAALADKDAVTGAFEVSFLGAAGHGAFKREGEALTMTSAPKDNDMHKLHEAKSAPCESCHAPNDPSPLNEVRGTPGGVNVKVRRERCLLCHGFGPKATLQLRCAGCHFEHPEDTEKRARFVAAAKAAQPPPDHRGRPDGAFVLIASIIAFPLLVGFTLLAKHKLDSNRANALGEAAGKAGRPGAQPEAAKIAESQISAAVPQTQLRPRIDLDLCVGCASCVHACPFNVLEMVDEKAKAVRMDDCTGYAACVAECPTEAITLVADGARRTQELPNYDESLETNVKGMYLAGEVTGKALIKVAINGGRAAVDNIRKGLTPHSSEYDVIVVGAGPAGTSAALAAMEAKLRVLVLEQGTMANTIRSYPRQKFVMAEPVMIPLAGPLWMADSSKEDLLGKWEEIVAKTGLVINTGEKVTKISGEAGSFTVKTAEKSYTGARVVIAIGRRGSPRKLGVPGEDLAKVAYSLQDAEAYQGKAICIVGGGDSGIEAANGMARPDLNNRVYLVHRGTGFEAAKPRNQKKLKKNTDAGRVAIAMEAAIAEIKPESAIVKTPQGLVEIPNDFLFVMVGGENPKKFLNDCGIEFSQRALT